MPQRTNEFQALVALIEQSLAPHGAKVTESAMVPGLTEENPREIDVLIESMFGPYRMKVAVEAKDENRRMDITKFEAIVAKYLPTSGVKVDKVVIIARAGFTQQVEERAKREGIELFSLPEAMASDWAARGQKLVFMIQPHMAGFDFEPAPAHADVGDLINSGTFVCTCCGRNHGSPMDFARQALADPDLIHEIRVAASKSGMPICARLEWNLAKAVVLRHGQHEYRVDRLTVHIHCSCGRGDLSVKAYKHGDHTVHHFSTTTAGKTVQFVLPDGHASERLVLKIDSAAAVAESTARIATVPTATTSTAMSKEHEELLRALQAEFTGLDARLDIHSQIHNFMTGTDISVDALARIYFGGTGVLSAAIIFLDGPDDQQHDRIRELVEVARGAELDRMLVICNQNVIPRSQEFLRDSPVRVLADDATSVELFRAICPPLVLWTKTIVSFDATVYSPDTQKLQGARDQATIIVGEQILPIQKFYDIVVNRILNASIDAFIDRHSPRSEYADCELAFDFRLPRGAKIAANSGEQASIGSVAGTALIRGMIAVLDSMQITTYAGMKSLRFTPAEAHFSSVVTAALPRTKQIHVEGGNFENLVKKLQKNVPESVFANLLGPVAEPDLTTKASCHTVVAKIGKKDDGKMVWSLQVFPQSKLRTYPSL